MIDYKKLLTEHGHWPLDKWNQFDFRHQDPGTNQEEEDRQIDLLRAQVAGKSGLYLYKKDGAYLYIGKGAPLFNRLKSHYRESFRKVPGDTKNNKWHRFFSSNVGKVTIYWKEVSDETDRRIFELALTRIEDLNTIAFNNFDRDLKQT